MSDPGFDGTAGENTSDWRRLSARDNSVTNLLTIISILVICGAVAFALFYFIDSQASIDSSVGSFGGAVAGFLATAYLGFRQLNQMRSADGEQRRAIEALSTTRLDVQRTHERERERLQRLLDESKEREAELRHKVLRGAPAPESFEIEVDERQRIVLARPEDWAPKGGVIFNYQQGPRAAKAAASPDSDEDMLPASLIVYAYPFPREPVDGAVASTAVTDEEVEAFYAARQHGGGTYSLAARIRIGGEGQAGIPSLRVTGLDWVEIDTVTRATRTILWQDYRGVLDERADQMLLPYYERFTSTVSGLERHGVRTALRQALFQQLNDAFISGQLRATTQYVVVQDANGAIQDAAGQFFLKPAPADQGAKTGENDSAAGVENLRSDVGSPPAGEAVDSASTEGNEAQTHPAPERATTQPLPPKQLPVVSPVALLRVYCVNKNLDPPTVFEFDFTDDPSDFTRSSEIFDGIQQSVRFLT